MYGVRPTLVAVILLGLHGAPASAQVVRGHLTGAGTERPVHGALVGLIDPTGVRHAVELSDASGGFVVAARQPGIYRLEVRRVGYRTIVSPALHLYRGDTLQYPMEVPAETIQLPAVIVEEERRCSLLPELGARTAATWEEARKALDITAWTEARGALHFHIVTWERELDGDGLRTRSEQRTERESVGRQPFQSLRATRLAAEGYVQPTGSDVTYYAPDAEVLLSETFLDDHCFRLQAGKGEEAGLVGLAFEPTPERELSDVAGVLWLDRATAELRYLEFEFRNLQHVFPDLDQDIPRHAAGGYVGFARLPTGAWIVRRWYIRMPVIQIERRRVRPMVGPELRNVVTVTAVREEGAEVTATFARSGEQLDGEITTTLLGTVFDSTVGRPLAGAVVRLVGTGFVARSDRRGAVRFDDVPAGHYVVEFTHPRYDAWNLPFLEAEITLTQGQVTSLDLAVPALETAIGLLCPDHPYQASDGLAVGIVADSATGAPVPDATVHFEWTQPGARPSVPPERVEITSDALGSYRACGLPPHTTMIVWATMRDRRTRALTVQVERGAILRQDLTGPLLEP